MTKVTPLRRTETYVTISNRSRREISTSNPFDTSEDVDMQEANGSDDVLTPKALKKVIDDDAANTEDDDTEIEDDEEFETPRALKMRSRNSQFRTIISTDEERDDKLGYQATQSGDSECGIDNFSDVEPELQQLIQRIAKEGGGIDKGTRGEVKKRAFRTEVQEARAAANKEKVPTRALNTQQNVSRPSGRVPPHLTGSESQLSSRISNANLKPNSRVSSNNGINAKLMLNSRISDGQLKPNSRISSNNGSRVSCNNGIDAKLALNSRISDRQLKPNSCVSSNNGIDAKLTLNSRISATTGNNISVTQATTAGNNTKSRSNPNTNPIAAAADDGNSLSDEDNSIERATILKSPPKGVQRLSSVALVKVEKPPGTNGGPERKSRSKGSVLGSREVVKGWSKSIEPSFIHWFCHELAPWPTPKSIAGCVQKLWDWRFGDSHPLVIANSQEHLRLLNQKLCDIRRQVGTAAIMALENDFQAHTNETIYDLPQAEIANLRKEYAEDLLHDKKFMFGKYVAQPVGPARKMRPYQGSILLQTFASFAKLAKDVQLDSGVPLPASEYPKTALAIAVTAVERALNICVNGDYNFATNKFIPKPDLSHPKKKLTTNMHAFSEALWKPRVEFYLEKGVSMLKRKDWTSIMKHVIRLSNSGNSEVGTTTTRTEEELELIWESDESEDGTEDD